MTLYIVYILLREISGQDIHELRRWHLYIKTATGFLLFLENQLFEYWILGHYVLCLNKKLAKSKISFYKACISGMPLCCKYQHASEPKYIIFNVYTPHVPGDMLSYIT